MLVSFGLELLHCIKSQSFAYFIKNGINFIGIEPIKLIPFLIKYANDWDFIQCNSSNPNDTNINYSSSELKKKKLPSGTVSYVNSLATQQDLVMIIKLKSYDEVSDFNSALIELNNNTLTTNIYDYFLYDTPKLEPENEIWY
jgi:hypothetical protein